MTQYKPFECKLSQKLQEKAEKELNEKAQWRERDIQALRDMVIKNRALTCPKEGEFLIKFLRAKKFDYDRAYNLIINYYTVRTQYAHVLKGLLPSTSSLVMESYITCILPKKDKLGRKIFYFRPGKWNPAKMNMIELLKINVLSLEIGIKDEETQVDGMVAIGNLADVGMTQAKNIDRSYIKAMTSIIQEAFPMRFKGLHMINEPSIFGYIFSIVKPFLKEKTVSRLHFHGSSLESLYNFFDLDTLPQELGGSLPHGDQIAKDWNETLKQNEEYFKQMNKNKIDLDSDLFGKKVIPDSSLGGCLTGSYKKIEN